LSIPEIVNVTEAYFREHASPERVAELERVLASTTPPSTFTPPTPKRREHRGKTVANTNARNIAMLRGMVPKG
jgi:hypothetical protein